MSFEAKELPISATDKPPKISSARRILNLAAHFFKRPSPPIQHSSIQHASKQPHPTEVEETASSAAETPPPQTKAERKALKRERYERDFPERAVNNTNGGRDNRTTVLSPQTRSVIHKENQSDWPQSSIERKPSGKTFEVTLDDLPWIGTVQHVKLDSITLNSSGEQFYFGDLIVGKHLLKAWEDADRNKSIPGLERLLFMRLHSLIGENRRDHIHKLDSPVGNKEIFYVKPKHSANRVYFVRYNLEGKNVILRVAMCDSVENELKILNNISRVYRKK